MIQLSNIKFAVTVTSVAFLIVSNGLALPYIINRDLFIELSKVNFNINKVIDFG